jgi:hypothetical protein
MAELCGLLAWAGSCYCVRVSGSVNRMRIDVWRAWIGIYRFVHVALLLG